MSQRNRYVSVVVRTRDVESRFEELLKRLSLQTLKPSELIIVDNFSKREKLNEMEELLRSTKENFFNNRIPVKLVPLLDSEFSHAYSTNVGVFVAKGDLVCITNGHSLPFSSIWIESGLAHFDSLRIAGVGGYVASHRDGTVWEKFAYDWWWKALNEKSRAYLKDSYFSTMNCILRKSLWEEYCFDEKLPSEIPSARKFGGEDFDWAMEMLARGYKIVVEPGLSVYHSHRESFSVLFSKYLAWRHIKKQIMAFRRPRKSYTRVKNANLKCYDL
jgi:glycosyltransferase involved in cell wall biosynthesis